MNEILGQHSEVWAMWSEVSGCPGSRIHTALSEGRPVEMEDVYGVVMELRQVLTSATRLERRSGEDMGADKMRAALETIARL